MDRFQKILEAENLCFLCLESANYTCDKCELPYCNQEHYNVHYDDEKDYCYPFRVLQKPEVLYSMVIVNQNFDGLLFISFVQGW